MNNIKRKVDSRKRVRPPRATAIWRKGLPTGETERRQVSLLYKQIRYDNRYFIVCLDGDEITRVTRSVFDRSKFLFREMLGLHLMLEFEAKMDAYDIALGAQSN